MNHKKIILILAAPTIILSGCGGKDTGAAPVKVKLETVSTVTGRSASYYSGTIEARKTIPLSFLTLGTVAEVNVREGQKVEKGELLAKLDCQSNENSLRMAEAKSKQADDAYRRYEPMYKNGNLPEIKMVEIETAKTEAALSFKLAAKNAGDCSITAPESGIISERAIEPGSSAIPGKSAMTLVSVDQVYAAISVPEREISAIKPGTWAEVEIAALTQESPATYTELTSFRDTPAPATKLRGMVTDAGVTANPMARTYAVRVLLNNPGRRILPGMICNVHTASKDRTDMALVPATAINIGNDDRPYVYTVDLKEKIARKRIVETAGFANGGVVVSRGVSAGDIVVSEGAQKLSDGTTVETDEAYAN